MLGPATQLIVRTDRSAHSRHRQISSRWAQTDELGVSHCMIISNAASGSPPIILAASLCPLKPISARRAVHRSSFLFFRCWMEAVLRLAVARLILGAFCAADLPLRKAQTLKNAIARVRHDVKVQIAVCHVLDSGCVEPGFDRVDVLMTVIP